MAIPGLYFKVETLMNSNRFEHLGFTVVEAIIALAIIAIFVAILLPVTGHLRRYGKLQTNMTQVRGIHIGMTIWGKTGKRSLTPTYYPGLTFSGLIMPGDPDSQAIADGSVPAARFELMLNGNFITPEFIINPMDHSKTPAKLGTDGEYREFTPAHFSYSLLALPGTNNESHEWADTKNSAALVMSDRAIGTGPDDISSRWTPGQPGIWRGHAARNDGSVVFAENQVFTDTQYGEGVVNPQDDLFADDPDADDAFLVHEDAITAYSVE